MLGTGAVSYTHLFPGTENEEIKPGEKADRNKNERDHG